MSTSLRRTLGMGLAGAVFAIEAAAAGLVYWALRPSLESALEPGVLRNLALVGAALPLIAGVAGYLGSGWVAARAYRPVGRILEEVDAIRAGRRGRRLGADTAPPAYHRLVSVLNELLEGAERALLAQRRFTADASHELRTPLAALRAELELARATERSPEQYRHVLASTLSEVDHLSRLVDDLLILARYDSRSLRPRLRGGDLAECTRRAAERLLPTAGARGVKLIIETPPRLEAVFDPDLVERVVRGLTDNAVRFTPAGGRADVVLSSENDTAVLRVLDTGPGIPADQLDRIFDRFYRGDPSRNRRGPGSGVGLGLAVVRAAVDVHGGTLTVSAPARGGTAVRVEIPCHARPTEPADPGPQPSRPDRMA